MFEQFLFLLLAILSLVIVVYMLQLHASKALMAQLQEIKHDIEVKSELPPLSIETIRNEMIDIVEDTLSSLQPPNAFDHLMGALAGPIQMIMMRKAGIDPTTGQPLVSQLVADSEDL